MAAVRIHAPSPPFLTSRDAIDYKDLICTCQMLKCNSASPIKNDHTIQYMNISEGLHKNPSPVVSQLWSLTSKDKLPCGYMYYLSVSRHVSFS